MNAATDTDALSRKGYALVRDVAEAAFKAGVDIEDIAESLGLDVQAMQILLAIANLSEPQ